MKSFNDIKYGDFEAHTLDLYIPDGKNFKTFVRFHGGGIEAGDKESSLEFKDYLIENNIAVVSANYRLYPNASYPDFIKDAALAVAWTFNNIEYYGGSKNIYVGGESAGAYLSMMLCFDKRWLAPYKIDSVDIKGYVHAGGQPTGHFNILREQGIDTRRVIIDEKSPIFHIGIAKEYSPMVILVSDNDMENRYEQIMLMVATIKHFGYNMDNIILKVMHGKHCSYLHEVDENGINVFGKIISDFINDF